MYKAAIKKAKQINKKYLLPPQLLIGQVCKDEGLDIIMMPLKRMSGMLVEVGSEYYIAYNAKMPPGRRLFTVAHELGHYFLHRGDQSVFLCQQAFEYTSSMPEQEANAFAAELLMPYEKMVEFIQNQISIRMISRKLGVSEEAARYRIKSILTKDLF